jgi:hypothetical protein
MECFAHEILRPDKQKIRDQQMMAHLNKSMILQTGVRVSPIIDRRFMYSGGQNLENL